MRKQCSDGFASLWKENKKLRVLLDKYKLFIEEVSNIHNATSGCRNIIGEYYNDCVGCKARKLLEEKKP